MRGHINGKDGIYAASLLVEMIAVTGKKLSELMKEIEQQYGRCHVAELSRSFPSERREELKKLLYEDKLLPAFARPIERVSYLDGCKVYFKDGGWVIARFSGTEPLLRVFGEMEDEETAQQYCRDFFHFLGIDE